MWVVYLITNKINNTYYIGKTNNINKRWAHHKKVALGGPEKYKKSFSRLHRAIRKYGIQQFQISILTKHNHEANALKSEMKAIKWFKKNEYELYNLTDGGDGVSGLKWSIKSRKSFSKKCKGRKASQQTRLKMSEAHKGYKFSKEDCLRRSLIYRGEGTNLAKLTWQKVSKIFQWIRKNLSDKEIAQKFKVNEITIKRIRLGKTWRRA